ncbi:MULTISPECIES: D-alanyl-D-alanine carboxypeptidase [Prochlorococcus]|uniref:D-alanyl-D-alanine carboxypeptidase n=1 Tax=Prochlorococcus TaxID=1218 RepID=UPI00068CB9D0|nr:MULTISPECIES: D-alanyl-D-alanine carboxypeptidase [Prochlorococcus]
MESIISLNRDNWSITTINSDGNVTSHINGDVKRIPASNQKLLTTAFALDKLGPTHILETALYASKNGNYIFTGQGDPDLSFSSVKQFTKSIKEHSVKHGLNQLNILIKEEPRSTWWPNTWAYADRYESYGAPITRLALTSNSGQYSFMYPLDRFKNTVRSFLDYPIRFSTIESNNNQLFNRSKSFSLINKIESAPLFSLLALSNSESHNFTSEVLLKTTSNTWDTSKAALILEKWIRSLPIPSESFSVSDGSGLSRDNLATTNGISHLLYFMDKHRYSPYYISSLSILGTRGTLKYFPDSVNLHGIFYGKTGTLNGVRSVSGYLFRDNIINYISIISNGLSEVDPVIAEILNTINTDSICFQ